MKNTTLVIMAAGIGSRFGGGIKQLEPVGPAGEIIMDTPYMMPWKQDLIKSYSLSAKTWRRILRKSLGSVLKKSLMYLMHFRN